MYCTECKCCLAQKDIELCIFCEDGFPCPGRKRQASGLEAKPSRPLVAEMYATRAAKEPNPKNIERLTRLGRANVALISGQVPQEEKSTIIDASPAPELPVAKEEEKTKMQVVARTPRLCECGCGEIAKSNASPYAKGHNPNQNPATEPHAGSPAKAARSKSTPPRKLNSTPAPMGVATICVTETHLDNYWMKLSLDEKAAIFTRQLEGA
jgi:hypothetical protein